MNGLKSLTLNGKTYDSFNDKEAVRSINDKKPDENGNINIGGGVSSWNDLTDKPFFDEGIKTATLDYANPPDVKIVASGDLTLYKVTDAILTEDVLKKATISAQITNANGEEITESLTIESFVGKNESEFGNLYLDVICGSVLFYILVATKTGQFEDNGDILTIAETGTYFALKPNGNETPYTMTLEYHYLKPIDIKFIPNGVYTEIDRRIENYIDEALGGEY
jgi:hypothetical protein